MASIETLRRRLWSVVVAVSSNDIFNCDSSGCCELHPVGIMGNAYNRRVFATESAINSGFNIEDISLSTTLSSRRVLR